VYLAYPGTHGAEYLQYNVVDKTVCPAAHRESYTESLVYMPFCYHSFKDIYSDVLDESRLPTRKDYGLPEDKVIYCTFNRLGRITEDVFGIWVRILKRVPNSVMLLYKHPTVAVLRLLQEARNQGLEPGRFIFAGPVMPKVEHLKRLTLADIYLDTLVYNGHTTGSDVLWAGVPMVTILGDTFPSRVGAALAMAMEMPEMITESFEEYEENAVMLGTHHAMRNLWRKKLHEKRLSAPLYDTARWVGSFEAALREIWAIHEANEEPRDISPLDPGNRHHISSCNNSTNKKWKEEKGDQHQTT